MYKLATAIFAPRPKDPGACFDDRINSPAAPAALDQRAWLRERGHGLVLESARGTFRPGSTISKADEYRIHLRTEGADKIWLIYHEKNDAPVTLVKEKSIVSGHSIKYPEDAQKGVKISTKAAFVTFEVRMQREGQVSRKYYVFGVE